MSIRPSIGLILVLLIVVFPIFSHLDDMPLQLWDEARLANNAIEMYETGNALITTYNYIPETWSVKPPMLIWLQVLSFRIFGINDLALRIPSALSALFTCLFLFWFFAGKFKVTWIGILSCIVLVCTAGYVKEHGIRTGDYDGPLTLFTTLYLINFYLFINENKRQYLLYTFLFIICATLTKGIAGLLFLPALFIYALYKKRLFAILKTPQFYIGVLAFVVLVVGYYLLRDHYSPGYIAAVINNELGGRYLETLEGHKGDGLYYYNLLIGSGYKEWYLLYAAGVVLGLSSTNKSIRDFTAFTFICCLSFIVVISGGGTKLHWYVTPMYPLMATTVATLLYTIGVALHNTTLWKPHYKHNILPYLFFFLVGLQPYRDIMNYVTFFQGANDGANELSKILKLNTLKVKYPQAITVLSKEYNSSIDWYLQVAKHKKIPIKKGEINDIANGALVATYENKIKVLIEETYIANVVSDNQGATIYQVHGRKER